MEPAAIVPEKARCPDCDKPLTTLYRQERPGGRGSKLIQSKAPWLECKTCVRVFPAVE